VPGAAVGGVEGVDGEDSAVGVGCGLFSECCVSSRLISFFVYCFSSFSRPPPASLFLSASSEPSLALVSPEVV